MGKVFIHLKLHGCEKADLVPYTTQVSGGLDLTEEQMISPWGESHPGESTREHFLAVPVVKI